MPDEKPMIGAFRKAVLLNLKPGCAAKTNVKATKIWTFKEH